MRILSPFARMSQFLLVLAFALAVVVTPARGNELQRPMVATGLQITTLPQATVGMPYGAALTVSGGLAPYVWTGSGLPAGLTLSGMGMLSGTPTMASGGGPASFTVQVKDASPTPQSATLVVGIVINAAPLGLRIDPTNLPQATVGVVYSSQLTAKGGTPPYTFAVASGSSAPSGLTMTGSGALSGTPTTPSGMNGPTGFVVTVTDSAKGTATATVKIAIMPASSPVQIVSQSLPPGMVGVGYGAQLQATGGVGPYAWKLSKGSALPVGLALSGSGGISGTPSMASGPNGSSFSVYATDSSATPQTATATVFVMINAAGPALKITSFNLPPAYVGGKYGAQLTAAGGTGPYTWALAKGVVLPVGLVLSPSGAMSGTPTAQPATSPVVVQVTVTDAAVTPKSVTGAVLLNVFAAAANCTHDGAGNAKLKGNYAMSLSGLDAMSGSHLSMLAGFVADGAGTVTGGDADANAPEWKEPRLNSMNGTYSVGADSRGVFSLGDGQGGTMALCFVADQVGSNGVAAGGWVIRADESGQSLAGGFALQDTGAFLAAKLKGNFTFGLQGQSGDGMGHLLRSAVVGYLTLDGGGKITVGEADMSQQRFDSNNALINQTETQVQLTGSYTVTSTGRGTLQLNLPGGETANFAMQVVSSKELRLLEIDPVPVGSSYGGSVLAGKALLQTVTSFSNATLKGSGVFIKTGVANAGTSKAGHDLEAGILSFDGNGNGTSMSDENAAGVVQLESTSSATYTVDAHGRVTLQPATTAAAGISALPTFYLVGMNQGFGVDSGVGVGFYQVDAQSAPQGGFTLGGFAGSYGLGTMWPTLPGKTQVGSAIVQSSGGISTTTDNNRNGAIAVSETGSGTLAAEANGRFLLTPSNQTAAQQAVYLVSPNKAYVLDISGSDGAPLEVMMRMNQ